MKLTLNGLGDRAYVQCGYKLPDFDVEAVARRTREHPRWVHFGAGNIMRAFPAVLCQRLIEAGELDTGMNVIECFDEEIIDKVFTPFDNLSLAVSLKRDGTMDKTVVGSIGEALGYSKNKERVKELFESESLQIVSFTITEKGYGVVDGGGVPLPFCAEDFVSMEAPVSIVGILAKLMYDRFLSGRRRVALVSLDNCSHNGTILKDALMAIVGGWQGQGLVGQEFVDYLNDETTVSFTWSMIDKITPRPSETVIRMLSEEGFEGAEVVVTKKNTYVSGFVNAEECEYLAIEDRFPAGRPPLEKVGVVFGDRETVDKIEKMKVCTCLNPLHTCLAVFGCLLGYEKISDEMKDEMLLRFIRKIGYVEGMPVVTDPVIMSVKQFIDEVVELRLPNPFVPDTPQRIACDTSKKLPVRFGETLKAYLKRGETDLSFLTFIPLVFAGYARYLTAVGDDGVQFERSPDPNLEALTPLVAGFELGEPFDTDKLKPLFSDETIFGVNLYDCGLGEKVELFFTEMGKGVGCIRETVQRRLDMAEGSIGV